MTMPWEMTFNTTVDIEETPLPKQAAKLPWEMDFNSSMKDMAVEPPRQAPDKSFDQVFSSLLQAESGGKHIDPETGKLIKSKAGALGITQLMPSTAKKPGYGIKPVQDESEAEYMRVGKEYLGKLYEKFQDWNKTLAAYNAGVGNVIKAEGKAARFGGDWKDYLPKKSETLPYIERILKENKDAKKGTARP